jgi:hypothetical protein
MRNLRKQLPWLRSLVLSGLFFGAQRLVEGANVTSDWRLVASAVAASVVSNYLINRANSQREAQLDATKHQELAQRNHHIRRGMAAALRRGLENTQREIPDLPAVPYHALFASWDQILQLAETDDNALEQFFPIKFTESHWQAANPYSHSPDEDANALAGMLRALLAADHIYNEWTEDQSFSFAKLAIPFYRQAFADALVGESDNPLYRAFEVKGINQIRALVQQAVDENRVLHLQTHQGMQQLIEGQRQILQTLSLTTNPLQKHYSLLLHNDRFVRENNATGLDSTLGLGLYNGIRRKLRQDFTRGALSAPLMYNIVHEKANADLKPISSKNDLARFSYLNPSTISSKSWFGDPQRHSINVLRNAVEALGRPLLVNCSSVNVAAYAVLKGFGRHGISIEVIPDDASGREQAKSLAVAPKFDFVVCADAPLFLDPRDNVRAYCKLFDIYHEEQDVLTKAGNPIAEQPAIYVYQASSAKHQFLLDKAGTRNESVIPWGLREEPLFEMADFAVVSQVMKSGDMVIAWGTLEESLLNDPSLSRLVGGHFSLTVSMFIHPNWHCREEVLEALFDLFVAEWNFCHHLREEVTLQRLSDDEPFLDSFARGGGFKAKFALENGR